jgi:heme/copper-type cytochrome/quinol oxidase subunit 2
MNHSRRWQWAGRLPLVLLPIIATSLTVYGRAQSSLDPAGPDSARISHLWWLMVIICTAVFLLVLAFMLHGI